MDKPLHGTPIVLSQNIKVSADAKRNQHMNVYIWDMDETLILLKSLLDGTYAGFFKGSKNSRKGMEIAKHWENHILQVCDKYFFYEQIESCNEPFLDALIEYDDGRDLSDYDFNNDDFGYPYDDSNKRKLAYRYRAIARKYEQGLQELDPQMIKLWNDHYLLTDSYADGWFSSGHALLEQALGRNKEAVPHAGSSDIALNSIDMDHEDVNVLVTSGSLVPSLVKCLLFQLDDVILQNNVYSSWDVGKFQCFSWIKERFGGQNVRYCVIGDGMEECLAAQKMNWPFIKIDIQPNGPHRFPGLTMRMIEHYMDVVYGPPISKDEDKE